MNENITNAVAVPMQSAATVINPLDDLATAVDEFKSRIRAMFDESTIPVRKVKEVAPFSEAKGT